MNQLLSIIVPVYKVPENYLRSCIESCQNQTYKDIEIILVDDGSPDLCGDICDTYASGDKRIKVIHKKNGGLSAARNTGFFEAKGDWVMFVDGDDWIEPDMCRVMYERAVSENAQLVMCGMTKDYKNSSQKYSYYIKEKTYVDDECRWLQQQLLVYNGNIATAYCKLIKRSYLLEYNILHDEGLRQGAEGIEFNLRLFESISVVCFINIPFYHYVYNENSISASHNEENCKFVVNCFEKIYSFISTSQNRDMLLEWFDNRLLYVIVTTAISGYFSPSNQDKFLDKKYKFENFLLIPIISKSLSSKNLQGISFQRKIVLFLIKNKLYFGIELIAMMRKIQKRHL